MALPHFNRNPVESVYDVGMGSTKQAGDPARRRTVQAQRQRNDVAESAIACLSSVIGLMTSMCCPT